MKAARKSGVPVLLDGQGGDEVLCGYRKYLFINLKELAFKRQWFDLICESFFLLFNGDRTIFNWRDGLRYLPSIIQKNLPSMSKMIKPCFLSSWHKNRMTLEKCQKVQTLQLLDIYKFSIPSLLRYEDRNSMAWSIESRLPFLDYRLVEFLLKLPTDYKIRRGRTKAVLRQALRGIVPDAILDRRDKVGFITPQEVWMKKRLGRVMAKRFEDKEFRLEEFVQQNKLVACFNDFITNPRSQSLRDSFFRIFILDAWMECFNVTP
jgi:asparagine synthase (glutamine-hydrolysing)